MATGFAQRFKGKIQASALWFRGVSQLFGMAYNTNTATADTTLTAANVSGGREVVLNMTGALAAGRNATLPTAANLIAALPNVADGMQYRLRIINSSSGAFAWTVVTNTGWTLTGTLTVAQNTWREFLVTITSVSSATATAQAIGTGTQS